MKIFIKNMVCSRCKRVVKDALISSGVHYTKVEIGVAEVEPMTPIQFERLNSALLKSGLKLMDNKKNILVEVIKSAVIQLVHHARFPLRVNFSSYLSEKTGYDYTYLANIFSAVQGISIKRFLISHKIERVKELLMYDELSLTEIASQLHYSSVAHLSNQFKKITGLTPSHFRKLKDRRRISLENV